ncbi:MAG TPA: DMT family transporter [Actinomycetota bacterium]|nr:DMT family transporter [Actinomycetota bacterium]
MGQRRRVDPGWLLLVTPVLWGATFPAAQLGIEQIGVLPFMAWTRVLGFITILVAVPLMARGELRRASVRRVAGPGLFLGSLIFVAYVLQTYGLARTTATNAGFITGLYVVFVPVLALVLFRRRPGRAAWVAVVVSVAGMILLSVPGLSDLRPRFGDVLVLASAVVWAGHVVAVGRYAGRHSAVLLSLAQMGAAAGLHLLAAIPVGWNPVGALDVWQLLVVTGVLGSGVAYTIQVLAQETITATRAVVIMAGETVSAAAFAYVWVGDRLEPHQWLGAILVLLAMVVSELGARRAAVTRLDPSTVP